ncbi:MAG: FtsQ-type POTRA domain-containing protein [Pseudomonadota bacterium]
MGLHYMRAERDAAVKRDSLLYPMLVLLAALLAGIALLATVDRLLAPAALPLQHVRFEGEFRRVSENELGQAVLPAVGRNFLLLDLDAVKQRVQSLPWVYRASVRRAWPRDLHVEFLEQQIVARWGERDWVNHAGEAVTLPRVTDLPKDMPWLHGPDGTSTEVLSLYQQLAPIFAAQGLLLERLLLTPRRSWQLAVLDGRTGSRFTLLLDRIETARKAERFARSYAQALAARAAEIRQVDLRYANGFAVQWRNTIQPNGG